MQNIKNQEEGKYFFTGQCRCWYTSGKPAFTPYPYSPYDGKWSKTMVGFGPEDYHFVAELTYNYGVGEYKLGNDFLVSESLFSHCMQEKIVLLFSVQWQ